MAYAVKLTARAERDLALLFAHINAEYSDTAREWYLELKLAAASGEVVDRLRT